MTTPEQKARTKIDAQLRDAGWTIQDMTQANPAATPGVAIHDYSTSLTRPEYPFYCRNKAGIMKW